MALRVIEVIVPRRDAAGLVQLLQSSPEAEGRLGVWSVEVGEDHALVRALVPTNHAEAVMDLVDRHYGGVEGFRLLMLGVEASLPRPDLDLPEARDDGPKTGAGDKRPAPGPGRISREELYADVAEGAALRPATLALTAAAAVVAVVGFHTNSVAVLIGSMVLAPLLGPMVALALATTLGDGDLARRAGRAGAAGFAVAVGVAIIAGAALPIDSAVASLAIRSRGTMWDVALGLAVGIAASIALTTRVSSAVVGVMVAVALLPPAVAFGLHVGAMRWDAAMGSLLLLLTYVSAINLSGVATFLAQGVRPSRWWEADRARRATRWALAAWATLLGVLVAAITLSQRAGWA